MRTQQIESTHSVPILGQTNEFGYIKDSTLLQLINKEQLNSIITNKDGTPDYLAINIYYDTLRSWYNPKIGYKKDGNIYHINKLKTKGVFLDYKRLSEIHGCSKETIRQKIVKLEELKLVHRSFQHKQSVTTKSYNQLIAYVWKDTPHFYNKFGVDSSEVPILKPQTNHKYIENKYGISFASNSPQKQGVLTGGGIQARLDTKELNNLITKVIRSDVREAPVSNLLQNANSNISTDTSDSIETIKGYHKKKIDNVATDSQPKATVVKLQGKHRSPNKRKKPLKSTIKAKIIKPTFYSKPKSLGQMQELLNDEIYQELRHKSGRDFSNNFISQKVLALSKKPKITANFKTKQGFISYMTIVLKRELHDAVKTSGNNFRLRINLTSEDMQNRVQEKFINEVEQRAITHVCPENQLKAKIAGRLEEGKAYQLLFNFKRFEVVGDNMRIHITRNIELTENDRDIILSQVQAVYSTASGGNYECIETIEFVIPEGNIAGYVSSGQHATQQESPALELPKGVWGQISRKLVAEFGEDAYRNWFSKLTAEVNGKNNTIQLKASSEFIADWVRVNYERALQRIVNEFGLDLQQI